MGFKVTLFATITILTLEVVGAAEDKQPNNRAAFLVPVIYLFQHATPTATNEVGTLLVNDIRTQFPEGEFWEWGHNSIDTIWLPKDKPKLTFDKDEFDGRDVIRGTWTNNAYTIEVVQTRNIFLIKLTPDQPALTMDTNRESQQAKALCLQLFVKTGKRWTGQGVVVTVTNLNEKIADASFNKNNIESYGDGHLLLGHPAGLYESLDVNSSNTPPGNITTNTDWFYSSDAKEYWFNNVHWLADKRSIAFFFEKREGSGPIVTFKNSFPAGLDMGWFK